jgi:molybdate transport system substrate-binding protein
MSRLYNTLLGYFLLVLCVFAHSVYAKDTLHVALASNFKPVLQTLLSDDPLPDIDIKISAASSGVLYSQISHGAPYDIFLSADDKRPQALINNQLAEADSLVTYAYGQLAVWQPKVMKLNNKLAIANPRFSPYGRASRYYADKHLQQPISYVFGNNINHAFGFVDSGNASVGIVALSSLLSAYTQTGKSKYLAYTRVPAQHYPPILQQGVVLKSANMAPAKRFMAFLMADSTQQKLIELGYKTKVTNVSK